MTRSIAPANVRASAALVLGAVVLLFATSGEVGSSATTTPTACYAPLAYPGASASRTVLAHWMGAAARAAGLPPELPVMAPLSTRASGTARHEAQRTRSGSSRCA